MYIDFENAANMQPLQQITKLGFFCCFIIKNDKVKEDEMDRMCSTHGEKRKAYMVLVGRL
jgi:hypothetical protein